MLYAFPALIVGMLLYMFWHAGISMRRDRIFNERSSRRRLLPVRVRARSRR